VPKLNKLNFEAINAALNADTLVPQWLPTGKKRGKEWVAANPNRADNTPGSFSINLENGRWKDFASGDSGKDLVSLYAYLFHADDQGAAARELAQSHGIKLDAEAIQKAVENVTNIEAAKPRLVMPVPADAPQEPDEQWNAGFRHPEFGKPSRVWPYRDTKGRLLMYVARYDVEPRKQVLPWSYVFDPAKNRHRWTIRGITGKDKRPLYGLDRLAAMTDADVLLVEGEKSADAAQHLMGDACVAMAWLGGVESADKVSVKPLEGRRVILWPDFDAQRVPLTKEEKEAGVDPAAKPLLPFHEQPGIRAMMALAQQLKGVAREVLLVGYDIDPENAGWDLADGLQEGWSGTRALEYMAKRAGDPQHIASGKASKPADAPAAANDNAPALPLDASVNPFGYVHLSDKGQPMNTVENLEYLFGEYGITARYNETRKQVELNLPGRKYSLDNKANCALTELNSVCARNRMPQSMLSDYVKLIADRNAYNPVKDWITSKPWDGRSRLQDLMDTITVKGDRKMADNLIYRWLLSCVAAVFMPFGFESHGVLVFTGEQGQGKTKWVKRLAPAELNLVLAGAVLDPNNKDTVINATSHWLVELGELDATFRKADVARLKSFITNSVDKVRRPYDRLESEYQRRTVFFASVNESKYLVDDTGNRRWWTIATDSVNYEHDVDVQQLWAELLTHYERGERWYLTREEQADLQDVNAEHEQTDPVEEQILSGFDWDGDGLGGKDMTATEVLLAIGYDKPNKQQATKVSSFLKKLLGEPKRKNSGRYFPMPKQRGGRRAAQDDDDRTPF
jgi:putative DNA primase/helicase